MTRHSKVAHVSYGYFLLTLGASSNHIYDNSHVRACDMIFCASPVNEKEYQKFAPRKSLRMTGHIKFDTFRAKLEPGSFSEKFSKQDVLDVLWTPHWRIANDPKDDTRTSNFITYRDTMENLARHQNIQLHVRPHPLLRTQRSTIDQMSYAQFDSIMSNFEECGAVVYPANEGFPYIDILMSTAILVSDFSSLIPEFCITRRPIIFCNTDDVWNNGKWIGEFGKELIETCCYIADNEKQVAELLNQLVDQRNHTKEVAMDEFILKHNLFPEGSAVDRICNSIEQELIPSGCEFPS